MLQHYVLRPQTKLFGGDIGRVPLSLTLVKQVLEFFPESQMISAVTLDSIDQNAVMKQQVLNLPWYTRILELYNREEVHDETAIPNSKNRHSQAIQEKL